MGRTIRLKLYRVLSSVWVLVKHSLSAYHWPIHLSLRIPHSRDRDFDTLLLVKGGRHLNIGNQILSVENTGHLEGASSELLASLRLLGDDILGGVKTVSVLVRALCRDGTLVRQLQLHGHRFTSWRR